MNCRQTKYQEVTSSCSVDLVPYLIGTTLILDAQYEVLESSSQYAPQLTFTKARQAKWGREPFFFPGRAIQNYYMIVAALFVVHPLVLDGKILALEKE